MTKEGQPIAFKIKSTEAVTIDTVVSFEVEHTNLLPDSFFRDDKQYEEQAPVLIKELYPLAQDTDFVVTTGTATILAGTDEVEVVLNTVDDGIVTQGVNGYRVSSLKITAQDNPTMQIHFDNKQVNLLIEDAGIIPDNLEIVLDMWGRLHPLANFEPLVSTSSTAETFTFGKDDDGDSLLRTQIIDDTPLDAIQLRPTDVVTAPDGEDLSTMTIRYFVATISGWRQ
ncbi:hypothetical protein [Pseudoalteromonas phage J2-1_QLiu-2017]|nr:hypothetical protein [Pseudoalteromonas phage J2-1_QLiu-2017]